MAGDEMRNIPILACSIRRDGERCADKNGANGIEFLHSASIAAVNHYEPSHQGDYNQELGWMCHFIKDVLKVERYAKQHEVRKLERVLQRI